MDLVTITTFSNSIEAHISKGRLESEGIACFLKDEHTINANPMYHLALGGIKLQVWEKDVERATALIQLNQVDKGELPRPYKNYDDRLRMVIFILFAIGFITALLIQC